MKKKPARPRGRERRPIPDTFAGQVARRIIAIRAKQGVSVDDILARRENADLNRATWFRLESGRHPETTGRMIDRAARALGVKVDKLTR